MGKKVVSYQQLLKEAISEFDTSKNVDVKGPMLDPILSYKGDGELPTYKDAASVLERYYYNQKQDRGVEVSESDYENDTGTKSKEGSEHTEGPSGEEQAGTSDASTIPASKDEKGKDIAKESKRIKEQEDEGSKEDEEEDKKEEEEKMEEGADLTEEVENAVIEKLIAEMEEEDEDEDEEKDEEEMKESDGNPSSDFKGVADAPKEKAASGPEQDTKGAGGTQQAGTGNAETEVPDRKDRHDDAVEPKKYTDESAVREQDDEMKDEDEEEEKDLDVDKEVKEAAGAGGNAVVPSLQKKMGGEDEDELEEAFKLFKEEIDSEDEEDEEDEGEEEKD